MVSQLEQMRIVYPDAYQDGLGAKNSQDQSVYDEDFSDEHAVGYASYVV